MDITFINRLFGGVFHITTNFILLVLIPSLLIIVLRSIQISYVQYIVYNNYIRYFLYWDIKFYIFYNTYFNFLDAIYIIINLFINLYNILVNKVLIRENIEIFCIRFIYIKTASILLYITISMLAKYGPFSLMTQVCTELAIPNYYLVFFLVTSAAVSIKRLKERSPGKILYILLSVLAAYNIFLIVLYIKI